MVLAESELQVAQGDTYTVADQGEDGLGVSTEETQGRVETDEMQGGVETEETDCRVESEESEGGVGTPSRRAEWKQRTRRAESRQTEETECGVEPEGGVATEKTKSPKEP